jgi:hypothetical protein
LRIVVNVSLISGSRKPSLGGPIPEKRQLSFRGQEVLNLRELETKVAEQAAQGKRRRKLLPTIFDSQTAAGTSCFVVVPICFC